ncbi:hypothetical protein AKJ29_07235 [Aliiroseovarius crassostreae]|uniref:Uncharacterized protein n=1 Tax=Aliiroseovarius crassostreae TaxID=154981 RepID=A0A0P7KF84_9RHOB|nr:hypothetical protein AKJ29_07235 [Aliiroseovarius crassostreae]
MSCRYPALGRCFFDTVGGLRPRLRPHNQNITVAARAMAEGKTLGHLSYRVATRGQSFRRPNMISITARQ